mmetsp:Transcript_28858/g.61495  ORF Transcript_28858/g.61495 Transcript_28858/m.61495 type:complete len:279 (+) Transcript_28858:185-1021(+)|eukprot:CAMPEP_0172315716 /NCGR_PEP_ID=MMETSP1058-20130122/26058_1 /TAXON_ID=83371 /ORGANISM="Detonula confervacea, Strain CCMP 353" /LENGTH=278 /DNA_ID=CAMNT_0013029857 /DNA_START=82 /DNA_END=918 /DNA_ORIENTATION=-
MVPESNAQLSRSMILSQRVSLIDNTLAQSLSQKRARDSSSQHLTKSKSDNSITARRPNAKFSYKNRTPGSDTVKIVSTNTSLSSSPTSSSNSLSDLGKVASIDENMCPYTFIESVLENDQHQPVKQMQPLHETEYLHPTEEQIAAYSSDVIAAVRTNDLAALREMMYSQGRNLRCCNRFGESLLHVACRRSNFDVVSFLLLEANVSPRIKDDYGRTPLHDACWRGNPEYDIVELLLSVEPRLAFVQDVRGHKPFQYARREHWGAWREFLDQKRDLIMA